MPEIFIPRIDPVPESTGFPGSVYAPGNGDPYESLEFAAEPGTGTKPKKPRFVRKRFAALVESSAMSPAQTESFMAGVLLDLQRKPEERFGLEGLFAEYCRRGAATWLSPLPLLRTIDEVLRKFSCKAAGRSRILSALVGLLSGLAAREINPSAFLRYVILPRLERDNDWRKWEARHFGAFGAIRDILLSLRDGPPFQGRYVGGPDSRLSADVVLVKYAGSPLALQPERALRDDALAGGYRSAWRELSLENPFVVTFMRSSVLHFMYAMSGRLELFQLTEIIAMMPGIERAFTENFPQGAANYRIGRMSLYDFDIARSLRARTNRGFKTADFLTELKAYLRMVTSLLQKRSGVPLCGHFGVILAARRDPAIAVLLADLIDTVSDRGGMHVYRWHARKLLAMPEDQRRGYIESVAAHGGIDPFYEDGGELFEEPVNMVDEMSVRRTAALLGIDMEIILEEASRRIGIRHSRRGETVTAMRESALSYKDIMRAYSRVYPERDALIGQYRDEFIAGRDRDWNEEFMESLDCLGLPLHPVLLRSVIRGMGAGFMGIQKSVSFKNIFHSYGNVNTVDFPRIERVFDLPEGKSVNPDRKCEREILGTVNIGLIGNVFTAMVSESDATEKMILPELNALFVNSRNAHEKLLGEELNQQVQADRGAGGDPDAARKKTAKIRKSIDRLEAMTGEYRGLIDAFEGADRTGKLLCGLFAASHRAGQDDPFTGLMIGLVARRYIADPAVSSRIGFLREDTAVEFLGIDQLSYIINTMETIIALFLNDEAVNEFVARDDDDALETKRVLAPFIITRNGECTLEAVDAALRRLFSYNRITRERARWQGLREAADRSTAIKTSPFVIRSSKSMMDSYYGDMGGICLSLRPDVIRSHGFLVFRLMSVTEREILGMCLASESASGIHSYDPSVRKFWHAFSFNPLSSLLMHLGLDSQLYLYLQFRKALEDLALASGNPVVLSGVATHGLVSNDEGFRGLVVAYEAKKKPVRVRDAMGLELYYGEHMFADALVMIDPRKRETLAADRDMEAIREGWGR